MNTGGQDSFVNYLANFSVKIFADYIKRTQNLKELSPELEIYIKVYCYGIVCTLCEILTAPLPVPAEEFVKLLEKSLPAPLKNFFYKS